EEVVAEAREFAFGEYATALLKAGTLSDEEHQRIVERYSELTGLSSEFVRRSELRVSMSRFGKRLLDDEQLSVGRFDSRYTGPDRDPNAAETLYDPSAAALFGPFTAALYQYLREDLDVERDAPYEILTDKVRPWSYDEFTNRYVQSAVPLSDAMAKNPHLKVFVANGYYDLATPFAAAEY